MRLSALLLISALAILLLLALWGDLLKPTRLTVVRSELAPTTGPSGERLFVTIHGYAPEEDAWLTMSKTLQPHGAVLRISYNAFYTSNADPEEIARRIDDEVDSALSKTGATRVVLVAHSMGALIARRTLLKANLQSSPWVARVERAVLLAGVSRGWDISGDPPTDGSMMMRWVMRTGYWFSRMLRTANLLYDFERGTPFVANLRLDWMEAMRDHERLRKIEVVQLLGDIDDIVRREDNEDLRVMNTAQFALLRVRGTDHGGILDFGVKAKPGSEERRLGEYRCDKLLLAATKPFAEVRLQNEELQAATDANIKEVVFVLHGIRDLGRWSADFENTIRKDYPERGGSIAVVSSRYGYFGMGPFLFKDVRTRYVRWFMDEYTETLARFPNVRADKIRFFGHSNGTYILAEALQSYTSMHIDRIVFAGSVVPRDYEWHLLDGRVHQVRNYVGTRDWVVALFPRFFELPLTRLLGNDVGSAGFNGFNSTRANECTPKGRAPQGRPPGQATVDNVCFIEGEHGAFDTRVQEIVGFLLGNGKPVEAGRDERGVIGKVLSWQIVVIAVWILLATALTYLGVRVVAASPQPAWPVMLLFALLLVGALRTA